MSDRSKITEAHRRRGAVVYVRQSTPAQLERNHESRARQYALRERAVELGWPAGAVVVLDEDLGRSGASTDGRLGFKELVAEVGLGQVGWCWPWRSHALRAPRRTGISCWTRARWPGRCSPTPTGSTRRPISTTGC